MYLKKTKTKNGRIHLSIVDSYYDKVKKYARQVTIESLGYLDEAEKQYDDPIAHFQQRVEELKKAKKEQKEPIRLELSINEKLEKEKAYRKNFGHVIFSHIYHHLRLHTFWKNRSHRRNFAFDTNIIFKLLIFTRLLCPGSKYQSFENRYLFFERNNFNLQDVYRALTFFNKKKDDVLKWLHDQITEKYGRDTSRVFYDVTNYYFETDTVDEEDYRRKGVSKEHRPNPIVQMGLFMDNQGIPITYQLFPGNTNDCMTYRPNLKKMKLDYGIKRAVVVADKGMTTRDNIWYTLSAKDGYVFSMSVRGANKELKAYVINENGYEWLGKEYKRKSRLYPRDIQVTTKNGKKATKQVHEKQVVFWSEKYAKKAKYEREKVLQKARSLIEKPGAYKRATSMGASSYIKNITFDKKTGEILTPKKQLQLDEKKIKEQEALDGYYVLITSEYKETDDAIIDMYRGLWRIEETFRVTKSNLEARPVYVSRKEHIEAHFLTCFVSLTIARILELEMEGKYSVPQLLNSLRKAECTELSQNYYLFDYYDDILEKIGEQFQIDFSARYRRLGEIKKILAQTKKG
ncbi:IS1634 family transposase [Virgibacillus sp. W0181]|uniref:IS1634 family transposase n=1 Tax=Virgibacillus sp. W0181 TaxID=3391581 RepID=UPI003F48F99E